MVAVNKMCFTSLPVSVVISADVISAMTSFPLSLGPMLTARDSDPQKNSVPDLQNTLTAKPVT